MAKKIYDINVRSEEIQDLMVKKPSWMVRWGITSLFLLILLMLFFTWVVKYPDMIEGRVVITANEPPLKVVNRVNGKVQHLFFKDNQEIKAGDIIAEIQSPISWEVISYLQKFIDGFDHELSSGATEFTPPDTGDYNFGDLQMPVNNMRSDIVLFNLKLSYDLEALSIKKLTKRIEYLKELIKISEELLSVEAQELANAEERYKSDKRLYEDSVLSKYTFMQNESEYHKKQQQFNQSQLTIVEYKLTLNAMEVELESLKYNRSQNRSEDIEKLLSHREFIINFINTWKQDFALIAPVNGWLTYLKPLYEGQSISAGETNFAIVQDNHEMIGWIDVASDGYGKVEVGQKVNVRLDNYPFHEYGMLQGVVVKLGLLPDKNRYSVGVKFPDGLNTTYKYELPFSAEMVGSAEIITRDKRLLQRIFDSIAKLINRGHHTSKAP
jgi:HlyD family secretion protein